MAETLLVQPDREFIEGVMASGGEDLKKCFQCGTCSSVCSLSKDDWAFPRKQMIRAQWGLKEKLLADPGIWLCHDCGDCTANCPRGARPSDVMGALRKEAIKRYAFPHFAGAIVTNPRFLPILLLIPFLIFGAIALTELHGSFSRPFVFAELFPQNVLEALFFSVAGLVVLSFAVEVARFVKALRASGVEGKILPGLAPSLVEIITHQRFSNCTVNRERYWGHMLTFFGFVGLAVMGTAVGIGSMVDLIHTPLPLLNGWKLLANFSAGLILVGVIILLVERAKSAQRKEKTTYFDSYFLLILAGVAATGILSELLRLAQSAELMYSVYFIHLILIFNLFLFAPYSKFAHFVYRTVAMAATRASSTGEAGSEVRALQEG
jgi:quinone-modifying oxidoreductase subunit QmoC